MEGDEWDINDFTSFVKFSDLTDLPRPPNFPPTHKFVYQLANACLKFDVLDPDMVERIWQLFPELRPVPVDVVLYNVRRVRAACDRLIRDDQTDETTLESFMEKSWEFGDPFSKQMSDTGEPSPENFHNGQNGYRIGEHDSSQNIGSLVDDVTKFEKPSDNITKSENHSESSNLDIGPRARNTVVLSEEHDVVVTGEEHDLYFAGEEHDLTFMAEEHDVAVADEEQDLTFVGEEQDMEPFESYAVGHGQSRVVVSDGRSNELFSSKPQPLPPVWNSIADDPPPLRSVLRDSTGQLASPVGPFHSEQCCLAPLRVLSLGKGLVNPIGFQTEVLFKDVDDPSRKTVYTNEVLRHPAGYALFRITCEHRRLTLTGLNAHAPWRVLHNMILLSRGAEGDSRSSSSISGTEMFGLECNFVRKILRRFSTKPSKKVAKKVISRKRSRKRHRPDGSSDYSPSDSAGVSHMPARPGRKRRVRSNDGFAVSSDEDFALQRFSETDDSISVSEHLNSDFDVETPKKTRRIIRKIGRVKLPEDPGTDATVSDIECGIPETPATVMNKTPPPPPTGFKGTFPPRNPWVKENNEKPTCKHNLEKRWSRRRYGHLTLRKKNCDHDIYKPERKGDILCKVCSSGFLTYCCVVKHYRTFHHNNSTFRFPKNEIEYLEKIFSKTPVQTKRLQMKIAEKLGYPEEKIYLWFTNKRRRIYKKMREGGLKQEDVPILLRRGPFNRKASSYMNERDAAKLLRELERDDVDYVVDATADGNFGLVERAASEAFRKTQSKLKKLHFLGKVDRPPKEKKPKKARKPYKKRLPRNRPPPAPRTSSHVNYSMLYHKAMSYVKSRHYDNLSASYNTHSSQQSVLYGQRLPTGNSSVDQVIRGRPSHAIRARMSHNNIPPPPPPPPPPIGNTQNQQRTPGMPPCHINRMPGQVPGVRQHGLNMNKSYQFSGYASPQTMPPVNVLDNNHNSRSMSVNPSNQTHQFDSNWSAQSVQSTSVPQNAPPMSVKPSNQTHKFGSHTATQSVTSSTVPQNVRSMGVNPSNQTRQFRSNSFSQSVQSTSMPQNTRPMSVDPSNQTCQFGSQSVTQSPQSITVPQNVRTVGVNPSNQAHQFGSNTFTQSGQSASVPQNARPVGVSLPQSSQTSQSTTVNQTYRPSHPNASTSNHTNQNGFGYNLGQPFQRTVNSSSAGQTKLQHDTVPSISASQTHHSVSSEISGQTIQSSVIPNSSPCQTSPRSQPNILSSTTGSQTQQIAKSGSTPCINETQNVQQNTMPSASSVSQTHQNTKSAAECQTHQNVQAVPNGVIKLEDIDQDVSQSDARQSNTLLASDTSNISSALCDNSDDEIKFVPQNVCPVERTP
eukprot:319221_1